MVNYFLLFFDEKSNFDLKVFFCLLGVIPSLFLFYLSVISNSGSGRVLLPILMVYVFVTLLFSFIIFKFIKNLIYYLIDITNKSFLIFLKENLIFILIFLFFILVKLLLKFNIFTMSDLYSQIFYYSVIGIILIISILFIYLANKLVTFVRELFK